jgi:hypothetical protein
VPRAGQGFIANLSLGGPTPSGAHKAHLSDEVRTHLAEVALNEQGHARMTRCAAPCKLSLRCRIWVLLVSSPRAMDWRHTLPALCTWQCGYMVCRCALHLECCDGCQLRALRGAGHDSAHAAAGTLAARTHALTSTLTPASTR